MLTARLTKEFEGIRQSQWSKGANRYGEHAHLTGVSIDELFAMYYEEIADIANYGQMLYNKLRLLQMQLENGSFVTSFEKGHDEDSTHTAA
jgi:hypothetical protein